MLFQEMLDAREEKGREEGKRETIFQSVLEGDYSQERGAEKLNLTIEEFLREYNQWLKMNYAYKKV